MIFNTFTTTNGVPFCLWVEDAKGKPWGIQFMLTLRDGATMDMIKSTATHLSFGCAVLAAGIEWDFNHARMSELTTVGGALFEGLDDPDMQNPEPYVQFWTRGNFGIPVWWDGQVIEMSLNVFTERTSAHDLWGQMRLALAGMMGLQGMFEKLKPEEVSQSASQYAAAQQQFSTPPAQQTRIPAQAHNGQAFTFEQVDGMPVISPFDYKAVADYETQFKGMRVIVPCKRVGYNIHKTRNGNGTFQSVDFTPANLDNPQHQLRVYVDWDKPGYDFIALEKTGLFNLISNVGDSKGGVFYPVYKLNFSEKTGKLYWNFVDLADLGDATPMTPGQAPEPKAPAVDVGAAFQHSQDIPF